MSGLYRTEATSATNAVARLRAWADFTDDASPLRARSYDGDHLRHHAPGSSPPLPLDLADFAAAWQALSRRDRRVLALYYLDELPRGDLDVGGVFGVSRGTAHAWRHSALQTLGALLDQR